MYGAEGAARVSAMIDIHGDTKIECFVSRDGDIELRIGRDAEAYLFLTGSGADKLVRTLSEALAR
jgi:hypothetical protein